MVEAGRRATSKYPVALTLIRDWQSRLVDAKKYLAAAESRIRAMISQPQKTKEFGVGDQVLLSTKNLTFPGPVKKKLLPRWIGPFSIVKRVGEVAYRITLPEGYKIHNVFHASLLKPYLASGRVQPPPLPEIDAEGEAHFEVEAILAHRAKKVHKKTKYEYLIKWLGYPPESNSWEPEEFVTGAQELVDDYWAANKSVDQHAG